MWTRHLVRSTSGLSARAPLRVSHRTGLSRCPRAYATAAAPRSGVNDAQTAELQGPLEPPLLEVPIPQHFASIVSRFGDQPAVISRHQQQQLSYAELDRRSNALAHGLEAQGVKKGDRVAVSLGNNIEYATATYALFKLGAILVPLNPAFTAKQVASALNHLSASALIIGAETNLPRRPPVSNIDMLKYLVPDLQRSKVESEVVPSLERLVLVDNAQGRISLSDLKAAAPIVDVFDNSSAERSLLDRQLDANEIVNIQFTSGTTSMPKAACLSHRSILNNGNSIGDRMLLTEKDIVCCPPPLFHCFGSVLGYMATATHGSAIIFPTEAFDPLASIQAVADYNATALYGVPTMFLAMLELLNEGAVPREGMRFLRTGIAAGSSVPAALMRRLHKELNLTELTICYGMTETSPVSCMTTTDDPMEKRVNTVGQLLPHVCAKVVDPETRQTLGIGERGELAVNGYLVMKEYWGDEKKTRESLTPDETGALFMHTGDEASIDEDGYVTITGRIKDIIIRGGENIHPLDIENCLLAHTQLAEVSAFGVPDERYGEAVAVSCIRRKQEASEKLVDEEGVREFVRASLPRHFTPKYVLWTDALPKTPSGKIQRFKLRADAIEKLGLAEDRR